MSSSSLSCLPSPSSQNRQNLFQKTSSMKATSLAKRQVTVFKKARELSILCGIEVCVIYYGSDGELKTWPKDREKVKDMARRYAQLSDMKRRKGQDDLDQFLKKIDKDDSKKKKQKKVKVGSSCKYPDWDPRFDNCSVEQLTELIQSLEFSETKLQHRLRGVVETQRQRNVHYSNMAGQEQMITAMNHLQQHSNLQGYMDLYDHGIGTLPQLPVSTSAFKQSHSLAPIPSSLTMCQKPNMESYSSFLGVQETGMDHLQKHSNQGSMDLYDHGIGTLPQLSDSTSAFNQSQSLAPLPNSLTIQQNPNMESFSSLLGVQETGVNDDLCANMLPYNSNTNCGSVFSNQFLQNCYNNVEDYSGFLAIQGTGINNMNAEDYSGSLWTQGTGVNGFQNMNMNMYGYNNMNMNMYGYNNMNMNMYGYNNNMNMNNPNGFSQQLVQFPVQRTPPVFQYMDRSTQHL